MKEIIVPWLPFNIAAITLYPYILYKIGMYTPAIRCHEGYHYKQISDWGVIQWYTAYILLMIHKKYRGNQNRNHPLELPAYIWSEDVNNHPKI